MMLYIGTAIFGSFLALNIFVAVVACVFSGSLVRRPPHCAPQREHRR